MSLNDNFNNPTGYDMIFKGGIIVSDCIDGRSRNKNLFTTLKEATEFKESIDSGKHKIFYTAKKGDFIYIVISIYKCEANSSLDTNVITGCPSGVI